MGLRPAVLAFAVLAGPLAVGSDLPARLPPCSEVLAAARRVNSRFMREHPDPALPIAVAGRARPSNIWTRAVYYEGLMALYSIDGDPAYRDYALRWAGAHGWSLPRPLSANADDQCCGQTYLDLYLLDRRPERMATIKAAIDASVADSRNDAWWWVDALQMAMPVYARLGVLTGDPGYFRKMDALYEDTATRRGGRGLYNPVDHLWWRDASFLPPRREPNGAFCYWSRGNGWAFAALARVLDVLPPEEPRRAAYVRTFREMAAALRAVQRPDGFWNPSLLDPGDHGGRESSGTSLFACGFAWGIRRGVLPPEVYLPTVARAWNGLVRDAVHADGFLGYVQGTGKEPSDGQPVGWDRAPDYGDFGVGCFLLAAAEVWRLDGGVPPGALRH